MTLVEKYEKRLKVSEAVHDREHDEKGLSKHMKYVIAQCLQNTSSIMNEAFTSTAGTQRSDMGQFRKFVLDLQTVALPNLILTDLVITKPMTSITGFIEYISFVTGEAKGGVDNGSLIADPFKLGAMTENRVNYTSASVVETKAVDSAAAGAHALTVEPVWTPFEAIKAVQVVTAAGVAHTYALVAAGAEVADTSCSVADKTITFASDDTLFVNGATVKFGYTYDNVVIPQEKLPTLRAYKTGIALEAKARRIAIYYSQMAAFQQKTETGQDLGEVLASQAVAELTYETDTEGIMLLDKNAGDAVAATTFNKTVPAGVSMAEHYEAFAEKIENASQIIYDRTQKHAANYMICASNIKPVLSMMRGWKAASTGKINGPYFAGTLNGVKVYVSPAIAAGRWFVGYNGDDLMTSAAVYAPYMPVVPTQLLGFADGSMSQGFSSLYDLKMLNSALLVAGAVTELPLNSDKTVYQA